MTAINVIVQSEAVHVLTDGAAYTGLGLPCGEVAEVFPLTHLDAVVAVRGRVLAGARTITG